jgi:energy-converting hydrogenase Eha subunit C
MHTSAPHKLTWIVAIILGTLGIVSKVVEIPSIPISSFGLVTIGFLLLAIGTIFKGI